MLDGLDVEYDIAATVAGEDERAARVIAAGDQYDCDHAFIVGKSRSPTGKALFGDFAQRVVLDFGGYVTTATSRAETPDRSSEHESVRSSGAAIAYSQSVGGSA